MTVVIDKEPCFIFHTRDYQEHSIIVDLITLNYGHVCLLAQGARNINSPLKSLLQPFSPLKISMRKNRGDLFFITECSLAGEPYKFQIPNLFCAIYLNELLHYLYKSKESDPVLFASYVNALESINHPSLQEQNLRAFELNLLDSLGYGLSTYDFNGEHLQPNDFYRLALETGFVKVDPQNPNVVYGSSICSKTPIERSTYDQALLFPKKRGATAQASSNDDGLLFSKSKVRGSKLADSNAIFTSSFGQGDGETFDFVTPPLKGSFLGAIINQQFENHEVLIQAKSLTHGILTSLLGDNPIQSRKLYRDYLQLKAKQQQQQDNIVENQQVVSEAEEQIEKNVEPNLQEIAQKEQEILDNLAIAQTKQKRMRKTKQSKSASLVQDSIDLAQIKEGSVTQEQSDSLDEKPKKVTKRRVKKSTEQ